MKIVLAGIATAILIGIAVGLIFPSAREPAYQAFATSSVRVGEPGANLVGPEWQLEKK